MHLIWPSCHSRFDLLREKWSPFPSNWETHSNWVLQSLSLNLLRLYLVLETWVLAAGGQIRKTEASAQRDTEMRRSPRSPPGVLVPACPPFSLFLVPGLSHWGTLPRWCSRAPWTSLLSLRTSRPAFGWGSLCAAILLWMTLFPRVWSHGNSAQKDVPSLSPSSFSAPPQRERRRECL